MPLVCAVGRELRAPRSARRSALLREWMVGRRWPDRPELLVVAFAFCLRVQGLTSQSLWRDEVDSLRFATQPLAQLLQTFVASGQNGPLYYLLLRPWQGAAGRSEFSLRFFSVIAGTLAVPLVYRLGRRLAPDAPGVGFVSSVLAASSPYLVWYSQEARMYAAVVCLSLGSLECLLSALAKGNWWRWCAYAALTGATFYLHLATVLMLPSHLVMAALLGRQHDSLGVRRYLAALGGLVVLYLPLLSWQLPALLHPTDGGYAFVPFPQVVVSLAATYSSGVLARRPLWPLAGLSFLIAASFLCARRGEFRVVGALASWLVLPVLTFFVLTLVRPMFTARYLVFVLPAFLLLAALGWRALARRSFWLAGLPVAIIVVWSLVSVRQQATTPIKTDMRSAASFVVFNMESNEAILFHIPYARYTFEYYLTSLRSARLTHAPRAPGRLFLPLVGGSSPTWWIDGLYTNGGMSASDVDSAMTRQVAGRTVVWLVSSEVALWDRRLLVQSWLAEHGQVTAKAEFAGVTVFRYDLQ